ncbi:MAG: heme-copper oxidase subunit III [Myxococcota bacterium]|nr:heme-copper oxidase subunit III [Myxococcota bacterium]
MPRSRAALRVMTDPRPPPLLPSAVMGTVIFVFTEIMLFAGLISAFMIVRSGSVVWPPPGQPRLPLEATAFSTAALLVSAVMLYRAQRAFSQERASARRPLLAAIGLGGFFVLFQGFEWVRLIADGLTLTSSTHGGFFFLIVGMHALHAVAAILALVHVYRRLQRRMLNQSTFAAAQVFWYFVVGVWPVLYLRVYL